VQLAKAGPEHSHGPAIDPRWAGLQKLPHYELPQYETETDLPDPSGPGHESIKER
jgi:hypothetical protein